MPKNFTFVKCIKNHKHRRYFFVKMTHHGHRHCFTQIVSSKWNNIEVWFGMPLPLLAFFYHCYMTFVVKKYNFEFIWAVWGTANYNSIFQILFCNFKFEKVSRLPFHCSTEMVLWNYLGICTVTNGWNFKVSIWI